MQCKTKRYGRDVQDGYQRFRERKSWDTIYKPSLIPKKPSGLLPLRPRYADLNEAGGGDGEHAVGEGGGCDDDEEPAEAGLKVLSLITTRRRRPIGTGRGNLAGRIKGSFSSMGALSAKHLSSIPLLRQTSASSRNSASRVVPQLLYVTTRSLVARFRT